MKRLLEESEARLTPQEAESVWRAIAPAASRAAAPRWLRPLAAAAAAALLLLGFVLPQVRPRRLASLAGPVTRGQRSIRTAPPIGYPPEQLAQRKSDQLTAIPYLDWGGGGAKPVAPAAVPESPPPVPGQTRSALKPPGSDRLARMRNSVGGTTPVNGEAYDAMFFQHYGVNPFVDPLDDPFATFALDVDNASYTLTRAYLDEAHLPPPAAVRVEEFVNALAQDYPPPAAERGERGGQEESPALAVHLDAAPSPFGRGLVLLRVGIKAREIAETERKPAVLTFVIDVSGSMAERGRLEMVKRALHRLLDRLQDEDRVGLVVFNEESRVVLPPLARRDRARIERAIDGLAAEGSTNTEAGLLDGYAMAEGAFHAGWINRVILCTDGVANVGQTGPADIHARIAAQAKRGIELTAIGVGLGNYNDVLLEQLADSADGNYFYVDDERAADRIFGEKLIGTLQTVARQTKVQVEFDPGRVRRYRLIGYENRDVADIDFRNDRVDAGEVGAGHEVTALFELALNAPEGAAADTLATVCLRYESPETKRVHELNAPLLRGRVGARIEATAPMFRLDAAVAEFAEILRDSYWARGGTLAAAANLARQACRELPATPERRELVALMQKAVRLQSNRELDAGRFDEVRPRWDPDGPRR